MAAYNKIHDFVEQLLLGKHDFSATGHVFKAVLLRSTDPPVATDTVFANWTAEPTELAMSRAACPPSLQGRSWTSNRPEAKSG